jgi:hypothetical protein
MNKLFLFVACAFLLPRPVMGCTIPVFRYALEKWELTQYEILVSHRGPLPVDVQKELNKWSRTPSRANIDITIVDLDGKVAPNLSNNLHHAWKREGNAEGQPWMQVRYRAPDANFIAWTGPCTTTNLNHVLDSPMRQAILAHLTRGASTVFVMVNSDDPQADQQAIKMAWDELRLLEQKIKLPIQSKDGPQIKLPLPLKVSFPLLVLDRNRPEELALVRLLLATEPDLDKVKGPLLVPIFGRGRVLGSLSGKELNEEEIQKVAEFLCRECSCRVKDLNPGVDLLVVAEWNSLFDTIFAGKVAIPLPAEPVALSQPVLNANATPPSNTSVKLDAVETPTMPAVPLATQTLPSQIVTSPNPPSTEETTVQACPTECPLCQNWLPIAIGIAGALVLVTGAWAFYSLRS